MSIKDQPLIKRVKAVLHYNRFIPDAHFPERLPPPFHSKGFKFAEEGGILIQFTAEKEAARTQAFCDELLGLVNESPSLPAWLDHKFSELLECDFQPTDKASPFWDEPSTEIDEGITQQTLHLLERLPRTPLELPGLPPGLPSAYFDSFAERNGLQDHSWENLRVTSYLSTNVIRLAMCTVIHPWIARGKLSEFVDHVAALVDAATQLYSASGTHLVRSKCFVVRAFLWTSWQRAVMIYFCCLLRQHLELGVDDEYASRANFLQSFSPISGISMQEMSKLYANVQKSHYMCAWAFELFRKNPVCIGMDFRRFHKTYSEHFDRYPARCTPQVEASCRGDHPHSCQRFIGMVIKDQSVHDTGCTGCEKLTWDEVSYRSVVGAKAVSFGDNVGNKLRYRAASKKTLAISHVWSHGQGGRPETGMNRCLHRRFKSIARSMGCDSYWMDTPCIPTDHLLRREAISNINKIFAQSRSTLVCDRDLMEIAIEGDISVELHELILVTTIICDWNVRAWTFLEAFRARQSIHLLCKDNKTISLKETIEIVHRQGGLDIGALLLTVPHLLPRVHRLAEHEVFTADTYPHTWEIMSKHKPLSQGFLSVENSGMLLSHRPASRPGDDIVIWSLLLNEKPYESAIDFWRSRKGFLINTSFLVSTTPRINIWRLGWAPITPRTYLDLTTFSEPRSMGINDDTAEAGRITTEGLEANWLFCKLGRLTTLVSRLPIGRRATQTKNIKVIRKKFLQNYQWGALLRPVMANGPTMHAPNRENISCTLVVVCGTNDLPRNDTAWEWKGVHEWDPKEPLPTFTYKERILLV